MWALTETILFVFGMVAFGYLAGWTGYLKVETGDALSTFAVGVALPLLLFRTMAGADFHGAAPWALWGTYFTAVAIAWTAGHLTTTRIFGRDSQAGVVGGVATAFSNLVLLGIPFTLSIFGQAGFETLSLLIGVHLPVMILASMILFEVFGPKRPDHPASAVVADFISRIVRNPLIVGILGGLAWRFLGLPLSGLFERFVDSLADVAGPVALFAMGLGLRKFGISGNVRPAFTLSLLKLMLMPAVALAVAWAVGLPPLTAKVVVAAAALPSGVNSYLIAMQLGTGQALASNQMTIATAMAAVTTALWVTIATLMFG
ncbi:MAG: AEC family transporter [Rhizobiaceae bacterium]